MIDRRRVLLGGTALAVGTLAGCGGGNAEETAQTAAADSREQALGRRRPAPPTPSVNGRVVVIGAGMAGATVAKYLRLWGGNLDVTLVDRSPTYTSCIMSSLVLTGQRSLSSLRFGYDVLGSKYGVKTLFGEVRAVDPVNLTVAVETESGGIKTSQVLRADRIVMAPGIEFDPVPDLAGNAVDPMVMPHAWKAGAQTTLLANQLAAMAPGGTAILTIPKAPYRCPPGPYERACLLADWLKQRKPRAKLIVLDANPDFVTERDNFGRAFFDLHGTVIEYHNNAVIDRADPATGTLHLAGGGSFTGNVVNLIPTQRAPRLLADTGLLQGDPAGRFATVNVLDYASTVAGAGKIHVIGDSSKTTQPKAGHIANQEAKVCADALCRIFAGGQPDPAPVTNSACFSTITMQQASWLHALFQYDSASASMLAVPAASGASIGWNGDNFEQMGKWFTALMADSFA